ncbi:cytosine permease, partial [Microbacterium laevaniformans]|uniref:cytosine permease n=1 Tax=Microbacterium laevaniformans TaxID=36807 RepID=UPI0031ED32FD
MTSLTPTSTAPSTGVYDIVEAAGMPTGAGNMKPQYDERLANEDLAPLRKQKWSAYNIFAFWMSDVHSVGGYVTAGSLFALGLQSWQVLIALLVGIVIVQYFANLVAKPSQKTGVPYPVVNRAIFGIRGANIPPRSSVDSRHRPWYGVQTFLTAAESLNIVFLNSSPARGRALLACRSGAVGPGGISYGILWVARSCCSGTAWSLRRFIDFAGPAVYVVMIALAV